MGWSLCQGGNGGGGGNAEITLAITNSYWSGSKYATLTDTLTGTDVYLPIMSFGATNDLTVNFSGVRVYTNTSRNEGYFGLKVNGVLVHKQSLTTETWQEFTNIPSVNLTDGDMLEFIVGYDGTHSNCKFYVQKLSS